jgi:serine/threonine-protein kinase
VKIMDFGIARLQSADITGSGAIVGTPTYMAPEQITNGPVTPATDLFSVGCLLYELLAYRKPFEGETVHGVLYQVLTTDPRPLRTMAPSIPAALERVVAKAMNKVPHERYESAGQMMATLQGIRSALSGADDEATQPLGRWTPLPRPMLKLITHAPMKWRVAVLGALAAVVLLLVYAPGPSPPEASGAAQMVPFGTAPAAPPPTAPVLSNALPPAAADAAPVSLAVSARRDSALAARGRAVGAGALKNNVPSMILAETMFQAAERALQAGDQARALQTYVASVQQYGRAQNEARVMNREAQRMVQRVTPVVQAIPTGPAAANAGAFLARAESLLREQDFTLAKVAAQSAEQIGIDVGIAPPSTQPAEARAAIDVLLADLGRALSSERIANIRVLYPALTEEERTGWEAFFKGWNQITATFTIDELQLKGSTATGAVRAVFQYVPERGGAPRVDRRRFAMRFEKKDVGWRLAGVSDLK